MGIDSASWRSGKAAIQICEAAELIANRYCDEDDTYYPEVERLKIAIAKVVDEQVTDGDIPYARVHPVDDVRVEESPIFTAYNQAIEDAKAAIRGEHVDDPYATPIFINAIARKCSPHVYAARAVAEASVRTRYLGCFGLGGQHDVTCRDGLVVETQRRADAVVDAAIAWHESGQEGGDSWFEKSDALTVAINYLLELRA